MIDCHCHILPGIDDGAHTVDSALAMADAAVAGGTRAIICTPHHLNGLYVNHADRVRRNLHALRQRLDARGIRLDLHLGSELHLSPDLPSQVVDGVALTYNDRGQAALIELPKALVPDGTERVLQQLLGHGVTPVIAHPERNLVLARREDRLIEWLTWGCKVQLTAQSCSGAFGERLQHLSRRWLERGMVHLIGSDAHRPVGRSPDTLAAGRAIVQFWLGDDAAALLTRDNPQRLLNGETLLALPARPPQPVTARFRRWLQALRWRRW
jgi:protein-tyrosine phosphatase